MSPFLYHESMSIPRVNVNSISPSLYHESVPIQKYRNTNNRFFLNKSTEIQIAEMQKYKLQEHRTATEEELPKGPRGTLRSKWYLMVQVIKMYLEVQGIQKVPKRTKYQKCT